MPRPDSVATPRIDRMGESALLLSLAAGISPAANARVHNVANALKAAAPRGLIDLVPAYSSLLVRFDPDLLSERYLLELLDKGVAGATVDASEGATTHEVPVRYGGDNGPDLDQLARTAGITAGAVVRMHSAPVYRVYFVGFMPGFAYMGPVPAPIAAPRLDSPRVRVPAGSVGIAGMQTGIYPLGSPGGWRLLGRTAVQVWDPYREPPSLFAPGDRVRFVPVERLPSFTTSRPTGHFPSSPAFKVIEPGALTTVQDLGRPGYAGLGLSQGGAMDPRAAARANLLVGNDPGAALLEITWSGPTLLAERTVAIALAGADLGCIIEGNKVPPGVSWLVRGGSTVRFEARARAGGRAYLAVSGGLEATAVLGSRSTYLPANFGGHAGRQLKAGDVLGIVPRALPAATLAGRLWPQERVPGTSPFSIRFTRFLGPGAATPEALNAFAHTSWSVTPSTDRMGTRLRATTDVPPPAGGSDLVSFGVVRGAIQLPPGGEPVILNADHQTTGGYPLIGVVVESDWPLLAQLSPGDEVHFVEVSVEEARSARRGTLREMALGAARLRSS